MTVWKIWDGVASAPVWGKTVATELYDHRGDVGTTRDFNAWENSNVAAETQNNAVLQRLLAVAAAQFQPSPTRS